jgi:hypothetical protein
MDLEGLKNRFDNNHIVKSIKTHWLYWLDAASLGAFMSNLISTPIINAVLLVLAVFITLIIITDHISKSKIYRRIVYAVILIVYIPSVIFWWNDLVYALDRDNPYKKPLQTGTATLRIVVSSDSNSSGECDCKECAWIQLWKDREFVLEMIAMHWTYRQIGNNEVLYEAIVCDLDTRSKFMGKPLSCLADAEHAQILFYEIRNQKVKVNSGLMILTFNSSVRIEIPIPAQIAENFIVIPDIQKYFKKRQ